MVAWVWFTAEGRVGQNGRAQLEGERPRRHARSGGAVRIARPQACRGLREYSSQRICRTKQRDALAVYAAHCRVADQSFGRDEGQAGTVGSAVTELRPGLWPNSLPRRR